MKNSFVTIHCHFYQPPRENPWIEAIEQEESAYPFHDWNERVTFECYRPNAYGRILDEKGKILEMINNYSSINFNFGPTLLRWLKQKAPLIYQKIIDADRESIRRFGSGNAIAQSYHHIILPLAGNLDKETEISWGIIDFEKHFNRRPESIWLPETAVNYETLEILIKYGFQYIILSPFQASRVRPLGSKKWSDVSNGKIDTIQPYRCFLKDSSGKKILDKYIDIFFYNGVISKEIAFGDLLTNGDAFCNRFKDFYQEAREKPQLIHVATDGETYGHHKKFGDLALAYAIKKGFSSRGLEIINYGAFLKRHPPVFEVEIDEGPKGEGSSWSCSHGVGRWKEDCGCFTGGDPGWNQKWRGPLREALNWLRDELYSIFINEGESIFKDPLEARNSYINVILDRSKRNVEKFFEEHAWQGLSEEKKIRGLKLLEMQRHGLAMFTSCGWFFADISGLESQIILRYAARALDLAKEFTDNEIENRFLNYLYDAKSNIPEMGDGTQIYQRFVKPKAVSIDRLVNQYLILSLLEDQERKKFYCFNFERLNYEGLKKANSTYAIGRLRVTSDVTYETKEFLFALISTKKSLFRTWISETKEEIDFNTLRTELLKIIEKGEEEIEDALNNFIIGNRSFSLSDILQEYKEPILKRFIEKNLEEYQHFFEELYSRMNETTEILRNEGIRIPYYIQIVSEIVLSNRLLNEIRYLKEDFQRAIKKGEVDRIVNIAKSYNYKLRTKEIEEIISSILIERMKILSQELTRYEGNEERIKNFVDEIVEFLDHTEKWGFNLRKEESQDIMGEILEEYVYDFEMDLWRGGAEKPFPPNLIRLAEKLGFNVERFHFSH